MSLKLVDGVSAGLSNTGVPSASLSLASGGWTTDESIAVSSVSETFTFLLELLVSPIPVRRLFGIGPSGVS